VVERGGSLCLAPKAGERKRIPGHLIGQKFQGNETVQARVFGLVNETHPATT